VADDPVDKLAQAMKARKPPKKVSKAQRTLLFAEPNFTTLQRYCRAKGVGVGEFLDELIEAFLSKVKDDLPED
jgi:hypothetical protein